jgi:hypothetical protein
LTEELGSRAPREGDARANFKGELNNLAMKILGRPVAPGDVVYSSRRLESGQYQADCRCSWMPGHVFESPAMARKKDAEQMTAHKALEANGAPVPYTSTHLGLRMSNITA